MKTLSFQFKRLTLLAAALVAAFRLSAETALRPEHILYVGPKGTPHAKAYEQLLRQHFSHVDAVARKPLDPALLASADVVLLDWSQSDQQPLGFPPKEVSLGRREDWSKPTVLLGSAGLLTAVPWQMKGGWG